MRIKFMIRELKEAIVNIKSCGLQSRELNLFHETWVIPNILNVLAELERSKE